MTRTQSARSVFPAIMGFLILDCTAFAAEPLTPGLIPNVSMAGRPTESVATPGLDQVRQVLNEQMRRVDEQARLIDAQRRQLEDQRSQLEAQQRHLDALERMIASPTTGSLNQVRAAGTPSGAAATPGSAGSAPRTAQAGQPSPTGSDSGGVEGSTSDDGTTTGTDDSRLADVLAEVGRVLTRQGMLIVEPQFQFSHNTAGQFFYNGVEIIPGIQFGVIEISENERNTFTNSLGLRYGITNRIEADLKVPFVINEQQSASRVLTGVSPNTVTTRSVSNSGLGDVEFGGHYQINRGLEGWPFFVGNVRVKTPTGEGPFDIDQDDTAVTGSGFWAVEPSVTVIYPTDPAVLFANVGYTFNMGRDVDSRQRDTLFTFVEPGDVLRTSFGVGIGLNERLSTNFGYKHDWVRGSRLEQRPAADPTASIRTVTTDDFQVGSLQFGLSYKITESIPVIVNVSAGVTSQAPDAEVSIRVPVPIELFD